MKKRSLFAAVAMLIVSAILLTSSTYAWFAASHEATVAKVSASIEAADLGNIQVKSENTGWQTSLTAVELIGGDGTKVLSPVDIDPTSSMSTVKAADFDTLNYTVSTLNATQTNLAILHYQWQVKAAKNPDSKTKIVVPVTFESGSCMYGRLAVGGTLTGPVFGPENDGYTSLGTCTSAVDVSGTGMHSGIIESGDTLTPANSLGAAVPASGSNLAQSYTLELTGSLDTAKTIDVYVWVEGQDLDCVNSVTVSGAGFTFGQDDGVTGHGIHFE